MNNAVDANEQSAAHDSERPPIPLAGVIYGDIIYWITVVGAFITIAGTVWTFVGGNNYMDPVHMLSASIEGKSVGQVWTTPGVEDYLAGEPGRLDETLAAVRESHKLEEARFRELLQEFVDAAPAALEASDHADFYAELGNLGRPNDHWYLPQISTGNGLMMFGLALGVFSVIPAIFGAGVLLLREGKPLFAGLAALAALITILAMIP